MAERIPARIGDIAGDLLDGVVDTVGRVGDRLRELAAAFDGFDGRSDWPGRNTLTQLRQLAQRVMDEVHADLESVERALGRLADAAQRDRILSGDPEPGDLVGGERLGALLDEMAGVSEALRSTGEDVARLRWGLRHEPAALQSVLDKRNARHWGTSPVEGLVTYVRNHVRPPAADVRRLEAELSSLRVLVLDLAGRTITAAEEIATRAAEFGAGEPVADIPVRPPVAFGEMTLADLMVSGGGEGRDSSAGTSGRPQPPARQPGPNRPDDEDPPTGRQP
jgi:hypothetical protein